MTEMEARSLASGWIARYEAIQRFGDESSEAKATFPVFSTLATLIAVSYEDAWRVVLQIIEQTENEFVLENVAAGPLETLLCRYGNELIERIEERAAIDTKFRWVVGGVWEGRIPKEIWGRLSSIADRNESPPT